MQDFIISRISKSIEVKQKMLSEKHVLQALVDMIGVLIQTFRSGGKVLLCGNGGSAADAQHIAAELSGRFYLNRDPLFAEALHVNTSALTAVANDYSFEEVYARMIKAMGQEKDILIAISTSGNSANILKAIEAAKEKKMSVIGFSGASGGKMKGICDIILNIPSTDTPRIQEAHILAGHILCEMVEKELFGENNETTI
jgi:D-sedoheptulose 7-phosphate isomerase